MSDQMEAKASESQGGAVLTVEEITKGSYIFPNGDKYEGECTSSESGLMMRSGVGKHTSADGATYTGEWREDKMHGTGSLQLPSGALYRGQFKDNMFHGAGTYTFPDGCIYTGRFSKNRLEGDGAFTDPRRLVWTGKFRGDTAAGLKLQQGV